MGKIILASSSPRRAAILKDFRLDVIPSPYKEKHTQAEFSYDYVENLAYNKAHALEDLIKEDAIIVGADTVVVLGNEILEKPKDFEQAKLMLKKLSDKKHFVVTAIAMINTSSKKKLVQSTTSYVTFNVLSDEMIKDYVENYKPLDKAGAYGIQELPKGFVKKVEGDEENIIGVSSATFKEMLKNI